MIQHNSGLSALDFLRRNIVVLVISGAFVISMTMGLRSSFGLFLGPMSADLDFDRSTFGFAMALQNLLWGAFQPFSGMVADRYGSGRVLVLGALTYAIGLYVMSGAESALGFNIGAGWLIGFGMSATSFSVVLGAVGRLVPPEKQSIAFGIVTAGGSIGQFVMAPIGQSLIESQGWSAALMTMAWLALTMAIAAVILQSKAGDERKSGVDASTGIEQSMSEALAEAARNKGYIYLTLGFFVCGFQVAFITIHLPAYISDMGLNASVAATSLALIGLFNIIGTYTCGVLGGRHSKKYLLSGLYFLRAIVVLIFLIMPKTEISVYLFAAAMGVLWLGTVPLTSGLVAQIFGVRFMSTLFGIVFLSHQLGSFLGVWMGGYLYDTTGTYDLIWYGSIGLGILAALIHLPIVESPVERLEAEAAT